ncbi:prephenate dehydrogenase [Spirochaetia bacterium]|nr:prephenate dehydrogenase [Spirochaetia bacterium]
MKNINYGIVGLGLMGGSFALALRSKVLNTKSANALTNFNRGHIFAIDKNTENLQEALDQKIIDQSFSIEDAPKMLALCDFVFICLYPKTALEFLIKHKNNFKNGSIVTDISGIKTDFIKNINLFLSPNFDFICAHPMAGSEKEGMQHSRAKLFEDRNYILMPLVSNTPENLALFKKIVFALGFSRITESSPSEHDTKIAFTSQLCHVIASALVESAPDTHITNFGGGSFEDLTRIAMINAPLWAELFLGNKAELLTQIEHFECALNNIKKDLQDSNYKSLCDTLQNVRVKRIEMSTTG